MPFTLLCPPSYDGPYTDFDMEDEHKNYCILSLNDDHWFGHIFGEGRENQRPMTPSEIEEAKLLTLPFL